MGAVCGGNSRPKSHRERSYLDPQKGGPSEVPKDTKEIPLEKGSYPAQIHENDPKSPSVKMPNIAEHRMRQFEKINLGNGQRESFQINTQRRNSDELLNGDQRRFSENLKDTLQNRDQGSKIQLKPIITERVDKPKPYNPGIMSSNPIPSVSLFKLTDQNQRNLQNLFEPTYESKAAISDDYYLDMNEQLFKDYQQFLSAVKTDRYENPMSSARSQTQARTQSQFLEWSKLLQKHFNQEKTSTSLSENKNKLAKIYKVLLTLDERNWYEEMVSLYKEKQIMSKATGNMTGLTFDRKIIQLQEQFQWLVSAVANTRLNPNTIVGVHDFPPHRVSTRRKGDRLDVSVFTNVRNPNSVTGSDEVSEIFSPVKIQPMQPGQISSARGQIGGFSYLEKPPNPRQNYYLDFPDIFSPAWQQGFLWKGVYFKLYSKLEAHKLKKELKALKHLGIEYLQTETSIRISDPTQTMAFNPNESLESSRLLPNQNYTILLPLVCTVESSSWVLLATPIFPVKSASSEENLPRIFNEGNNWFKNTFLLNSLANKNFKTYYKADDNPGSSLVQTYTNLGQTSYRSSGTLTNITSVFLLMNQVSETMMTLPKVNLMMIINQDNNSNISIIEYQPGGLDVNTIKKALGYEHQDIETKNLFKKNSSEENPEQNNLYFDVLKFKRQGWRMQLIHVTSKNALPPNFLINKRVSELLNFSNSKRHMDIKGNVLLFGELTNENSIVHPYFISEQVILSNLKEEGQTWQEGRNKENIAKTSSGSGGSPPLTFQSKAVKESVFRSNFASERLLREERLIQEQFNSNIVKSIESVVYDLDNSDQILNSESLRELFHRKGINMRFEWIVYTRLKRESSKVLVGADIIARCVKQILNYETTKRLKYFKKQIQMNQMDLSTQKRRMEEVIKEKSNLFSEDFYKKHLCQFINMLVKGTTESLEYEANSLFFQDLSTELFLYRMKALDIAKRSLTQLDFDFYLSSDIIKDIINIPCLHSNIFLNAISHHSKVSINYDVIRQIRNDKYVHWVSNQGLMVKSTDLNIIYSNDYYLTTSERCYVLLLKLLPNFPKATQSSIELILPSALYKIRPSKIDNRLQIPSFDCFLYGYYELPDLEILNDWVILLESILNGLYTPDGQQNLLIEAYLIQMIVAFFGEGDSDNQLTLSILERINTFANSSPIISPELIVAIHTWYGILSESKLFTESEQSYSIALLILHKLYGDPRGRGGLGTPWELFITWRLSILARLQGKIQDAEYSEELFDATLATLKDNPLNNIINSHCIYSNPLNVFNPSAATMTQQSELSSIPAKANLQEMHLGEHPFPHWIHNLKYDETSSKIDTIESTFQKTHQLLKWMIRYIPIVQPTGVLWDSAYLRDFFLSMMQTTFTNAMSMSSISNNSIDKLRDKSILGLDLSSAPKSLIFKDDRKDRKSGGTTGNLVQVFEKDASTFSKKEINGTIYSWGQNDKGQVGTPFGKIEEAGKLNKIKTYYPKRIITLKNTIILSVTCGHSHSMAITLDGQLLAWGDNKFSQLGLGPNAPQEVYIPTLVSSLKGVSNVSCGHEHTIALTRNGLVYSWGEGEGGLLGHGDTLLQSSPKRIEAFNNIEIQTIVCGGLHTLALTKQGYVYAWGKAEGGQLGISRDQLSFNPNNNHLYLTTPKRVRSALEGAVVVQIACGDAHSLALTQKGLVYSWGYAYQGQLGLGISSESVDSEVPCQVTEPTLVEKLVSTRITDIYAGATFSLFLSDKKELYGCGLNESNQLGVERMGPKSTTQFDRMSSTSASRAPENSFPTKLEFFTSMPVLKVACGEAHSLALVVCDSSYMLFSWGIQKQGQLGIGDIQIPSSTPRNISFLQYVMPYSMGCGAYHSLLVLGEPSKAFNKDGLIERLEKSANNFWSSTFFVKKGSYESTVETVLNNADNILPSEEGKIDDPKAINKGSNQL